MTHRPLKEVWGQRVRAIREDREITLLDLARRSGVDPGNLSRFERGLQHPSDDFRMSIARGLSMKVSDLFPYPDAAPEENFAAPGGA